MCPHRHPVIHSHLLSPGVNVSPDEQALKGRQRVLSPFQGLPFRMIPYPGLTPWAKLCRRAAALAARGAGVS